MNRRRLLLLAPFGAVLAAGGAFISLLGRMESGTYDPRGVPSMLIGQKVRPFALPGDPGLGDADLAAGYPVVVNFFASWCVPCVEEAAVLLDLKRAGVKLYGIAYKDKPGATAAFLAQHGNPYTRLARDEKGLVGIDWGITGVPETYVVDGGGVVRWRFVGPMPAEVASRDIPAELRKYA